MQKVFAVVSTLFRCGVLGGLYGALLGVIYALLLGVADELRLHCTGSLMYLLPFAVPLGSLYGFPAGFISGVLGGCLGGPIGYAVGGVVGTSALMLRLAGGVAGLRTAMPDGLYPVVWGGAFGLMLGLHIRRRVPLFLGVEWLADSIYRSPLGGWPGWRHRHGK